MTESRENIREKNLIPFQPGQSGNPSGKAKGQRDYATIYREALIKLGTSLNKTPDDLELELLQTGLLNAKKGDYRFYKDVLDRVHGTPVNTTKVDHTTLGEKIDVNKIDMDALITKIDAELKEKKLNGSSN